MKNKIASPWAKTPSAQRREPDAGEVTGGFPCGPLDRPLFNELTYRMSGMEAEVINVIVSAGITPDENDLTQLQDAINAMIALAGGPDLSAYISFAVARTRFPIYPHATTTDGKLTFSASTGQVILNAGQSFLHRGIGLVSTDDPIYTLAARTKTTTGNKTYHYRWRYNAGVPTLDLLDLANVAYNPSGLAETHTTFDSTYDDALLARVVTDASNNLTVTALVNLADLKHTAVDVTASVGVGTPAAVSPTGSPRILFDTSNDFAGRCASRFITNWARTPKVVAANGIISISNFGVSGGYMEGHAGYVYSKIVSRYQTDAYFSADWNQSIGVFGGSLVVSGIGAQCSIDLAA